MNHVVAMGSQKASEVSSLIGFDYEVDKPYITKAPLDIILMNPGHSVWKTTVYFLIEKQFST